MEVKRIEISKLTSDPANARKHGDRNIQAIDWIIYGGESGPGHRPEDKQWARDMHAKCSKNSTAFFHKQSAGYRTELGIELDGQIVREYPIPRCQSATPAS